MPGPSPEKLLVTRFMAAAALATGVDVLWPGLPEWLYFSGAWALWAGAGGALAFALMGLVQGFALRERHGDLQIPTFALHTLTAGAIAHGALTWVLLSGVATWSYGLIGMTATGALIGAAVGAAQSQAMRGMLTKRGPWISATAAGWGAAYAVRYLATALLAPASDDEYLVMRVVVGVLATALIGGITGVAALKLTLPGETDEQSRRADETGEEHRG